MKQIYDCSPDELKDLAIQYQRMGILSRAIQCYERLMFFGKLRRYGYLRLGLVYTKQGNLKAADRTFQRYAAIYK